MTAIADKFTHVGVAGTITALAAPGKAVAASSINITSATNWPTDTAVYFAIRTVSPTTVSLTNPSGLVAGTYTEWKGTLSGTVISNLTLQAGTDQIYAAGVNTQVFVVVSAARENSLVDGILVQHNQDGSHGNITTTGYSQSSGSFNVPTNAIQPAALSTGAITLGYAQITTNVTTASTTGAQLTGLSVTVSIPTGGRKVEITVYAPSLYTSVVNNNYGLSIWDGVVGSGTQIQASQFNNQTGGSTSANQTSPLTMIAVVTPSAGSKTYNVAGFTGAGTLTLASGATFPAFILVKAI